MVMDTSMNRKDNGNGYMNGQINVRTLDILIKMK
jgi:hypothetical protein